MRRRQPFCLLCGLVYVTCSVWCLATPSSEDAHQLLRREAAPTAQAELKKEQQQLEIGGAGVLIGRHDHHDNRGEEEYQLVLRRGVGGASFLEESSSHVTPPHIHELMKTTRFASVLALNRSEPIGHARSGTDNVFTKLRSGQSRNDQSEFIVKCEVGYTCVGGGCLARSPLDFVTSIKDPVETPKEGWRCTSDATTDDKTKKVWAICALNCGSLDSGVCDGGSVKDDYHICANKPCTTSECCMAPPTCSTFAGSCAGIRVKAPSATVCTNARCSDNDCCQDPMKCKDWLLGGADWQGTCDCANTGVMDIPNMEHHTCAGLNCTQAECCDSAPTCATFEDSNCDADKTRQDATNCCSGTCTCSGCYS